MCCDARCTPSIAILLTLTMRPHHAVIPSRVQDGRRKIMHRAAWRCVRSSGSGFSPVHVRGSLSLSWDAAPLALQRRRVSHRVSGDTEFSAARGPSRRRARSAGSGRMSRRPPPPHTQKRMKNTIYDNERKKTDVCARPAVRRPCGTRERTGRTRLAGARAGPRCSVLHKLPGDEFFSNQTGSRD